MGNCTCECRGEQGRLQGEYMGDCKGRGKIREKTKGVRVVSNAGGVNPLACAAAIQNIVQEAGLSLKVAVVTGDDLMPQKDSLNLLKMAETQEKKPLPKMVHSMNAYLGAVPIKRCLDLGADIVVTGRCVDSALVLGPLMHSFGWEQ
ncbi:hypothetical protein C0J50_12344, partial [Silurus asotus]